MSIKSKNIVANSGIVWKFQKTVKGVTLVVIAEVKKNDCWPISSWKEEQTN